MSFSSGFGGIPWQIPNPGYTASLQKDNAGVPTLGSTWGNPTMPNPGPNQVFGQEQGLLAQLMGGSGAGIGNALGVQGEVGGLAKQLQQLGTGLTGAFQGNLGYADQALKDAFDPQKAAEQYYLKQTQDTSGAQEAAAGIGNTPYGAAISGANTANFTNQWQNQQIQRENMGANTATTLQGQYEQGILGGAQLINQAGQLDINSLNSVLSAYGLQGEQLKTAASLLQSMLESFRTTQSQSGGGVNYSGVGAFGGGGGGLGGLLGGGDGGGFGGGE
jgi:hypothetical protein